MPLPTFIIIGAPRSGTTSLYNYLRVHPEVGMSRTKETNFFIYDESDPPPEEDSRWYPIRSREEYEAQFAHTEGKKAIGEASPMYLAHPRAPERIHRLLPEVRLIAILRNPVDRAYSGYLFHLRETVGRYDPDRLFEGDAEWLQPDSPWVETGFYHPMLRRYGRWFDRGRLEVYLYEDLHDRPRELIRDLYRFVGVDESFVPDVEVRHNVGGVPRSGALHALFSNPRLKKVAREWAPQGIGKLARRLRRANLEKPPPLPPAVRRRLTGVYRESILALESLLKRDLKAWLEVPGGETDSRTDQAPDASRSST
jgi:hypothetical protein